MKSDNVLKILKTKDLVIPGFLLESYKKLKLTEKELIFLSSLTGKNDLIIFDSELLSNILKWDINDIMEVISSLSEKKIINITVKKIDNKIQEYIDISALYEKILMEILNEEEKTEETGSKIYNIIEVELGRTLSPIEYETIGEWLNSNISEELIKEALKEAVLNGVGNLKYIDKILHEWTKKGYKKASDVKRKKRYEEKQEELFDYDWLDEDE